MLASGVVIGSLGAVPVVLSVAGPFALLGFARDLRGITAFTAFTAFTAGAALAGAGRFDFGDDARFGFAGAARFGFGAAARFGFGAVTRLGAAVRFAFATRPVTAARALAGA